MRRTNRTRDGEYTGHDKRVTLNLARLSAVCSEMPELLAVLESLPAINYDLTELSQASLELLYAEFDAELEYKVRSEFEADPSYLTDLRIPTGTCPLCGHQGCRFIFRLNNLKNGRSVECGSECIITYGLSVKGAETAAHAKRLLEQAIRRAIRAAWIEEWHERTGFAAGQFAIVVEALFVIVKGDVIASLHEQREARRYVDVVIPRLIRFYERRGWLNTRIKWSAWRQAVAFAIRWNPGANLPGRLPEYRPWEPRAKRGRGKVEETTTGVVTVTEVVRRPVPKEEVFQLNLVE